MIAEICAGVNLPEKAGIGPPPVFILSVICAAVSPICQDGDGTAP
jgi:hypothetical protein